jgi:hypothetical protein
MVRLSKPLYLSSPIVGIVGSLILGVGVFFVLRGHVPGSWPYLILGSAGLFYSAVMNAVFCYKIWESIQDGFARTSPGKAVGFLFIPIFNLYWIFQVIWGFSKDYNAYVGRNHIATKKLPEGLFLAGSVLTLTMWIPFLGIASGLAQLVVFSQVCDAIGGLKSAQDQVIEGRVGRVAASSLGRNLPSLTARSLALYCLSGEHEREMVAIPDDGISMGRDPTRVNLVLAASEISGVHARVLPQPKSSQIWLEDMRSLNGTFYSRHGENGQDGDPEWNQLQGKILLSPGARFRLAVDGPEFEIRES